MSRNPASILFNTDGYELAVLEGDVIEITQPGILLAGKDSDGYVQFFPLTSTGAVQVAAVGEREVVGEYYFGSDLIAGTGAAQNLITLENPLASGRNLYLNRVVVNGTLADKFTTPFVYKVARTTALPTGGTTQTLQQRSTADSSPVGVVRLAPAATAAGGALWTGSPGMYDKATFFQSLVECIATFEEKKEVVIAPGEAVVINAGPNGTIWKHWVNLHWNEVLI